MSIVALVFPPAHVDQDRLIVGMKLQLRIELGLGTDEELDHYLVGHIVVFYTYLAAKERSHLRVIPGGLG